MLFSISINLTDSAVSLILVVTWAKAWLPAASLQLCLAAGPMFQISVGPMASFASG
jgi:hypothetical protein